MLFDQQLQLLQERKPEEGQKGELVDESPLYAGDSCGGRKPDTELRSKQARYPA